MRRSARCLQLLFLETRHGIEVAAPEDTAAFLSSPHQPHLQLFIDNHSTDLTARNNVALSDHTLIYVTSGCGTEEEPKSNYGLCIIDILVRVEQPRSLPEDRRLSVLRWARRYSLPAGCAANWNCSDWRLNVWIPAGRRSWS
jgi:hypothetical protein